MSEYSVPDDSFLDSMRHVADPTGDAVIASVFANGQVSAVNQLLETLIRNDQPPRAQLPKEVLAYLDETAVLPSWADPEQIKRGERVLMERAPICVTSLMLASLPECYALGRGAQVLAATQQLTDHATFRILETAQLVLDVMKPGGMSPSGDGIRSVQRVRLLHATIRHLIESETAASDPAAGDAATAYARLGASPKTGSPICQEDMAYVVLTFSWVTVRSLRKMKLDLSPADEDAVIHLWAVVGHLMGVREELLPGDTRGGEALFERIKAREAAPTAAGRLLTERTMEAMYTIIRHRVIRGPFVSPKLPRLIVRELLSPETADLLGVPKLSWLERVFSARLLFALVRTVRRADSFSQQTPILRYLERFVAGHVVEYLAEIPRNWERGRFRMPEDLPSQTSK